MKKLLIFSLISLVGIAAASFFPQSTAGQKGKFRRTANGVPDRYIVVLNEEFVDRFAVAPAIESEAEHLTAQYGGEVKNVYANALKGFAIEMPEKAAIAMSRSERVAFVEQDSEISVSSSQPAASWGLDRIDQRSLPLNSEYSWGPDASNVHAYIIDTGIRPTHNDFGGRASADFDALTDGRNGIDCNGHGTHVAGTVGGATFGVAKNVRLHGVRVLPCSGSGLVSNLIMGIDWVTANRIRPAVANISITISTISNATDTAIQNSVNSGVTYAIAAGNSNLDACNYSPARAPSAIAVGALTSTDTKASYSNWGSCVDVWAPGSGITSASHLNDTDARGMSGTSMASPHIAGVAALYLSANPNASPATVASSITSTSTTGGITGLDGASPNRLAYSWLGSAPTPPAAGRVTIKKRATSQNPESNGTAAFPFEAVNFEVANFTLQPDNEFVDSNVTAFGSANTISVTEAAVPGWALTSIACVEASGGPGLDNLTNSTVDLTNRRADIVVEQGEQVECTFTSEALAPTAAYAQASGRVMTRDGRGVRNVRLTLLNATSGELRYVTTNTFGYYSFTDVQVGEFYVISAASTKRLSIADNVRSFTLVDDLYEINFRTMN